MLTQAESIALNRAVENHINCRAAGVGGVVHESNSISPAQGKHAPRSPRSVTEPVIPDSFPSNTAASKPRSTRAVAD
jgi:hypothetical protein